MGLGGYNFKMIAKKDIIFLPGMLFDHRLWAHIIDSLSPNYQCHFVDLLGCDSLANMFAKIDNLSLSSFYLCGFSMGGHVALEYALQNKSVQKLALVGYSPYGFTSQKQQQLKHKLANLPTGKFQGITRSQMRYFVHPSHLDNTAFIKRIQCITQDAGLDNYRKQQSATIERKNRVKQLSKFDYPTLLVGGQQDEQVSIDEIKKAAEQLPSGHFEMIEDCGHFIPFEQPERLLRILQVFFSQNEVNQQKF